MPQNRRLRLALFARKNTRALLQRLFFLRKKGGLLDLFDQPHFAGVGHVFVVDAVNVRPQRGLLFRPDRSVQVEKSVRVGAFEPLRENLFELAHRVVLDHAGRGLRLFLFVQEGEHVFGLEVQPLVQLNLKDLRFLCLARPRAHFLGPRLRVENVQESVFPRGLDDYFAHGLRPLHQRVELVQEKRFFRVQVASKDLKEPKVVSLEHEVRFARVLEARRGEDKPLVPVPLPSVTRASLAPLELPVAKRGHVPDPEKARAGQLVARRHEHVVEKALLAVLGNDLVQGIFLDKHSCG